MSNLFSRVYLTTEAIVICLPLTVLFVVGVVPAQIVYSLNLPEPDFVDLVSGLVTLAALVCLWRMIAAFLIGGRTALRRLSTYWWVLPVAGAALGLQLAAGSWAAPVMKRTWLNELVWGVPLLIPLLHLCLERWLSARVNPATVTLKADWRARSDAL
jgi:hypothetical protein